MSKPKGKDKKQENYEQLFQDYESQKRELLDTSFTLKKVQERLNFLSQQNHRLQKEKEDQYISLTHKIEELSIKNDTNQKRLIAMRNDLTNSEVQNKKLSNTISLLQKNSSDERSEKTKELQQMRKNSAFEIAKYENMLTDYRLYMSERDARQKQINQLIEARELEVANRIREVADKEREKIQATDKIKDEMSSKIREMRQNLLSLKKEELETTTRLTMLQNHQLTSELEYQSKQTEKIVFKNEELEKTILTLRQQLDIRKEVEEQLAKRSHFSKGIIKKLHNRVAELQQELKAKGISPLRAQVEKYEEQDEDKQGINNGGSDWKHQDKTNKFASALSKELDKSQKRFADLLSKHESLKRQHHELSLKHQGSTRIKNQMFLALLHLYTDLFQSKDKVQNYDILFNIEELRRKNPQQWTQPEKRGVLQQFISKNTLSIPAMRKIIVFSQPTPENKKVLPKINSQRDRKPMTAQDNFNRVDEADFGEDLCLLAKKDLSKEKYSVNIAAKVVSSKLREWGKPLFNKGASKLQKGQMTMSYRI